MGETYYEVLGIPPDATQEEIAAAYRRRALELHPDRNDDPGAAEQFKRLTTAESVLSDDRKRARYDRLGHDSYVRLARYSNGAPRDTSGDTDTDRARAGTTTGTSGTGGRTSYRRPGEQSFDWSNARHTKAGSSGRSAGAGTGGSSSRGSGGSGSQVSESDGTGPRGSGGAHVSGSGGAGVSRDGSPFQYAVHDWTDEIELDPRTRRLDSQTLIIVSCTALLYPVFVFASLAPPFPLPINLFVAVCTLTFVGYLLTMPKIALLTFGWWGLLLPLALVELPLFEPFSIRGLLAIALVWIPFGYAVAFRWALRL